MIIINSGIADMEKPELQLSFKIYAFHHFVLRAFFPKRFRIMTCATRYEELSILFNLSKYFIDSLSLISSRELFTQNLFHTLSIQISCIFKKYFIIDYV